MSVKYTNMILDQGGHGRTSREYVTPMAKDTNTQLPTKIHS